MSIIPDSEPTWFYDKFKDLPVLKAKPILWSDDDLEFFRDMDYCKLLLNELVFQAAMGGHTSPWPDDLTTHFAWLEDQIHG